MTDWYEKGYYDGLEGNLFDAPIDKKNRSPYREGYRTGELHLEAEEREKETNKKWWDAFYSIEQSENFTEDQKADLKNIVKAIADIVEG